MTDLKFFHHFPKEARNGTIDHQITEYFAMLSAERYDAIIDMGDKITPSHAEREACPEPKIRLGARTCRGCAGKVHRPRL